MTIRSAFLPAPAYGRKAGHPADLPVTPSRIKILLTFLPLLIVGLPVDAPAAYQFVDEVGRPVTVPSVPKRIISLAPNVTEILFGSGP